MKKSLQIFLVSLVCLFPFSSFATTVLKMDATQMVYYSSIVVRGKVLSLTPEWLPNKKGIVTIAAIEVLEELSKKTLPQVVFVRYYGGKIGTTDIQMHGGLNFSIGNEVLLVLESSKYLPKNQYLVVGLTQGKWIVVRPQNVSAEPVLVRDFSTMKNIQKEWPQKHTLVTLHSMKSQLLKAISVVKTLKAEGKKITFPDNPQLIFRAKDLPIPSSSQKAPHLK